MYTTITTCCIYFNILHAHRDREREREEKTNHSPSQPASQPKSNPSCIEKILLLLFCCCFFATGFFSPTSLFTFEFYIRLFVTIIIIVNQCASTFFSRFLIRIIIIKKPKTHRQIHKQTQAQQHHHQIQSKKFQHLNVDHIRIIIIKW